MKVLITGVAGHVGSCLAKYLLDRGIEVHGIDDFSCGYTSNLPFGAGLKFTELTLGQNNLCRSKCWQDYDTVFHFAAYAAEGLSPFIRQYNYSNNIVATAEVVNLCLENSVGRLVFASSMAVYGKGRPPFDEANSCQPIDPYGNAKLACERDIQIAGEQHGLDWCILRPHNIYGPGQSIWQKYRNVLGLWMYRHLTGRTMLVYGDGSQKRAFSWLDDCLPCFAAAATNPAASRKIINLGGAEHITIQKAAELTAKVMGGGHITYAPARHEVHEAYCSTARSIELLGYKETVGLEEGLTRMWHWAEEAHRQHPDRSEGGTTPIEVRKNLYSYWR